jgi:choline dehydrogenase-like flavoprotein
MFIDSQKLPKDEVIQTEVCIVGAGPAGITLARELIGQNFRVCLLEGGDLEFDEETISITKGETDGDPFPPLQDMRHRQFGGMANLWYIDIDKKRRGLRHLPLDEIDFELREWVPYSGWPFSKAHLNPFYLRAHGVCRLGPFDYQPKYWENAGSLPTRFDGDKVTTSMFQFGPRDIFTKEYRHQINKSPNVTTYLNANVTEIETDENQGVKRVQVACLSGNTFSVVAKVFVLAAGGIENARLLLQSRGNQKNGLGNQHDVVGRYFMDHPLVAGGTLIPENRSIFNSMALYDIRQVNNVSVMGKYTLTPEVIRREKLLNMSAILIPRNEHPVRHIERSEATASAKILLSALRRKKLPKNAVRHLGNVISNVEDIAVDLYRSKIKRPEMPPDLGNGGWSSGTGNDRRYKNFEVVSQTEQTPDPNNRVTLSDQLDRFGRPLPKLTNRWSERDIANVKVSQLVFAHEFANAGLGHLHFEWKDDRPAVFSPSAHHNMGTTRMNNDPKQGVVDSNCKVHGISNLFVAGSSVFPTGGYANPTLTIVALAIRLADHLKLLVEL